MIMSEKIIELRKKNGWSQEDLAEQLGVSRQSVSKWEGALSVPDINKVIAMSALFGVSTDYLLKEDAPAEQNLPFVEPAPAETGKEASVRWVSLEEANAYMQINAESAKQVALGVLLCIISPIFAMIPAAIGAQCNVRFTEDQGGIFGFMVLLLVIAAAVCIFVKTGFKSAPYDYLEKEMIETEYGVSGVIREKRQAFEHTHTLFMTIGIMLCVTGLLPLLFCALIDEENELLIAIGGSATLAVIAAGVYLIVRASIIWGGFQKLLEEGDYARETKRASNSVLIGIYWSVVTAAFLGYSFITGDWYRSWIIWPVAGVLSIAVSKAAEAFARK